MTTKQELFTRIAREHLGIETLVQRHRDSLDFHDVSVVGVQRALDAAYCAGQAERAAAALLTAKDRQNHRSAKHHAKKPRVLPKP